MKYKVKNRFTFDGKTVQPGETVSISDKERAARCIKADAIFGEGVAETKTVEPDKKEGDKQSDAPENKKDKKQKKVKGAK